MDTKIIIVIRSYSFRKQFLQRILRSLNNQTFKSFEICILNMDDRVINNEYYNTNSIDELFEYLDGRNIKYIAILDDDDSLSPEFLNRTYSIINKIGFKNVKAVTTHTNKVYEICEGNRIKILRTEPLNHHLNYGALALDTLRYKDAIRLSSCLFEYDSFKFICKRNNHDLKSPDFFFPYSIDFGSLFDIWVLEEAMSFYHIREISSDSSSNYAQKNRKESDIYIRIQLNNLYRHSGDNIALSSILNKLIFP